MFHKLRLQLTAVCLAITGLILTVLTIICLFISESGMRRQEYDSYLSNLDALYQSIGQQTSLSHNWIRQMEHSYGISIRLFDNGIPLLFQTLTEDEVPEELWDTVVETALAEYELDLRNAKTPGALAYHEEFPVKDENNQSYMASAAVIPRSGGFVSASVLHSMSSVNSRIFRQRIAFIAADLAALLLLGIFYWFFTMHILQPLQQNRKKQMQFVASASHELRSPLTVILSNVAAVKNGIMPCDDQFLHTLCSEGNRMSLLISDMLQLASADNHTWSLHPTEVELDTLLLQTWENYESMAAARNLHWDISLPDGAVPRCTCDAERICQLLSILIDNAFCYTPAGGYVRLSLSLPAANCVCIAVSDNGPGIPDTQKDAVFERFHRLDSSRKDKSHFGLGLCIAQEIVMLHRGKLLLTDTPGGGATFTVILYSLSSITLR